MDYTDFRDARKDLSQDASALQNDIILLICKACRAKNIGGMLFHSIPQDKTYTVTDDNYDGCMYNEVCGFSISENGNGLYLMTESDLDDLENEDTKKYVFLTPKDADRLSNCFSTPIEDTLSPTDTLCQLLYTIEEMLGVLEENGWERLIQSIQISELDESSYQI